MLMNFKIILLLFCYSSYVLGGANSVVWKGQYYNSIPIKKGISKSYCEMHCPGTFTHVVNEALEHPIYTDKGIKLANATFNVDKVDNLYLIHGSFLVSGKNRDKRDKPWQETIHYFLFKKSEYGLTQGIWYTNSCKGLYRGSRIS